MRCSHLHYKYFVFFFALLISFFTACKQGHGNAKSKYGPTLYLTKGDKYYYTIENQTTTTFEVNDKKTETNNSVKAGLIYEILNDSGGNYLIKMTFDKFNVHLKTANDEKDMTTENSAGTTDPVEQILNRLKGSSLFITVSHKGAVVDLTGYEQLSDKIMAGMVTQNESEKEAMRQQLVGMFGQGYIKSVTNEGFGLLPDTAIYVGDKWPKKQSQMGGINFNVSNSYTLSSIEDSTASIDSDGQIDETDSSASLFGTTVNLALNGTEEGSYHSNSNTGMLEDGKSNITIKGTVNVEMRDVPVDISIKKVIKIIKI